MPQQIQVSELNKYPIINFSREYPAFNEQLDKACQQAQIKFEPTFDSTNVGTLKRVIESGLGWGFLPSLSIKKQVKMGRLNHIHVKDFNFSLEFYFYHKKGTDKIIEVFYQALMGQERG